MDGRTGNSMNNPLWEYSLATYRLDEVAQSCLALQDKFGVDVNLLLYAAWLAHMERRLSDAHLTGLDALIADWRDRVVKPLRVLRRQLHGLPRAENIRNEIKVLELDAEQQQQDMMYAFYQEAAPLPRSPRSLPGNLALVARFSSPEDEDWAEPIEHLGTILSL
jgi:uncharacterized protein (TIGR02444 family)